MSSTAAARDPREDVPKLGLRNYWYPAAPSGKIRKKPTVIKLLGDDICFFRDGGKAYALHNDCPHRGMPLSEGWRYYPGTITCMYHGWTFDLTGKRVAALNEGPESQIPGKVRVRSYPVEERNGIVYVYMGTGAPPRIEDCVPEDLLDERNTLKLQTEVWNANWMPSLENLQDSHDTFVHRNSLFYFFRKIPAWVKVGASEMPDGKGVEVRFDKVGPPQAKYPEVGNWPKRNWWRRITMNSARPGEYPSTEFLLPSVVRVGFSGLRFIRFMVPVDENHVRAFLFAARYAPGFQKVTYALYYYLWTSWSLVHYMIGQDKVVFEKQNCNAPEHLTGTDIGLVKWRRLVAARARLERDGTAPGAQPRAKTQGKTTLAEV